VLLAGTSAASDSIPCAAYNAMGARLNMAVYNNVEDIDSCRWAAHQSLVIVHKWKLKSIMAYSQTYDYNNNFADTNDGLQKPLAVFDRHSLHPHTPAYIPLTGQSAPNLQQPTTPYRHHRADKLPDMDNNHVHYHQHPDPALPQYIYPQLIMQ
jgi:hypothetical protein